MKKVLVTGCGGQDGSFLADILLEKGYHVIGLVRHNSSHRRDNLRHLNNHDRFGLVSGDITDPVAMADLIRPNSFDCIYHEADQDNVGESFKTPAYSMEVTIKAVTNLLEIVKNLPSHKRPSLFLPSSATIFGDAPALQDETTSLNPQSPYAIGKAAVLHLGNLYRNVHGLKIVTGILYNHDSDRRNGSYFLHDVCRIAVECSLGKRQDTGDRFSDIEAYVNIGEARTYMELVVRLMEERCYDNFVIGTPYCKKVETWIRMAFTLVGLNYKDFLLKANPRQRPGNPETYVPNTSKLEKRLGIAPIETNASALVASLIEKYRKELQ